MKQKLWEIEEWGKEVNGKRVITELTLDNRNYKYPTKLNETRPLLTMSVSDRFTREELMDYLIQIRDGLNSQLIVEGNAKE